MLTFTEMLKKELAKEANLKNLGEKKAPPFGGKKDEKSESAPKEEPKKEAADTNPVSTEKPDPKLEKVAADMQAVQHYATKIASVIEKDAGADAANLFRNCISAVAHLKLAGYLKEEFVAPQDLNRLAYNMYRDIVASL